MLRWTRILNGAHDKDAFILLEDLKGRVVASLIILQCVSVVRLCALNVGWLAIKGHVLKLLRILSLMSTFYSMGLLSALIVDLEPKKLMDVII